MSVQGPGDNSIRLTESPILEETDQHVLMPASIRKDYKQLKIGII